MMSEHFALEYANRVNELFRLGLRSSQFYKHEVFEVPGLITALLITYGDQKVDSFIVQSPIRWEDFLQRMSRVKADWAEFSRVIMEGLAQRPEKTMLGWEGRTFYFIKGGSNPKYWSLEHADKDVRSLLSGCAQSRENLIRNGVEHLRQPIPIRIQEPSPSEVPWKEFPTYPIPRSVDDDHCWWCGDKADSHEHRIKRTDIVREFGATVDPDNLVIRNAQVEEVRVGPKANLFEFSSGLCSRCNNFKSQPFDRAQERFSSYLRANEPMIVANKRIRMAEVYPSNTITQAENLRRYFVKHIGCRLIELGFAVSHNIKTDLSGQNPLCDIYLSSQICEPMFEILSKMTPETPGPIGDGDITTLQDPTNGRVYQIRSVWVYRSFQLHWYYRWATNHPLTNPFAADITLLCDSRPAVPGFFGGSA